MKAKPKRRTRRVVLGEGHLIRDALLSGTWLALETVTRPHKLKRLRRLNYGRLGCVRLVAEVLDRGAR